MRPVPVLLTALLLGMPASAAGVGLRSLLTGSGGQLRAGGNSFVVVKRTSDLKRFELGVIVANRAGDRVLDLILAVKHPTLSPSELDLLRGNAAYAATRCFGLEATQLPAFNAWITQQNAGAGKRVSATFGKVTAIYVRQNKPAAPYTTVELYREADRPGVKPWVNYCTR